MSSFSLSGQTKEVENGTVLYLETALEQVIIDSTIIENNQFRFTTNLPESPLEVIIRDETYSLFKVLWLENDSMTLDGTQTDFMFAKVTGSESEKLSQEMRSSTKHLADDPSKDSEKSKMLMQFIRNNPNSIVSIDLLSVYCSSWEKENTSELYNLFPNDLKNTVYGKKIDRYLTLNKELKVGDPFVDFEMVNQHGENIKLSAIEGEVILLQFWASWCTNCRKKNPGLVKIYESFHPIGFEIYGVSLDLEEDQWLAALEHDSLDWPNVFSADGPEGEACLMYGISGLPDNFLIDKNGIIIARNIHGFDLNKKLQSLLTGAIDN